MAIIDHEWLMFSALLPDCYMPLKYAGYYWNVVEQELYSYKSGELKKLTSSVTKFEPRYSNNPWSKPGALGYQISDNGVKRRLIKPKLIHDGIKYMAEHRMLKCND